MPSLRKLFGGERRSQGLVTHLGLRQNEQQTPTRDRIVHNVGYSQQHSNATQSFRLPSTHTSTGSDNGALNKEIQRLQTANRLLRFENDQLRDEKERMLNGWKEASSKLSELHTLHRQDQQKIHQLQMDKERAEQAFQVMRETKNVEVERVQKSKQKLEEHLTKLGAVLSVVDTCELSSESSSVPPSPSVEKGQHIDTLSHHKQQLKHLACSFDTTQDVYSMSFPWKHSVASVGLSAVAAIDLLIVSEESDQDLVESFCSQHVNSLDSLLATENRILTVHRLYNETQNPMMICSKAHILLQNPFIFVIISRCKLSSWSQSLFDLIQSFLNEEQSALLGLVCFPNSQQCNSNALMAFMASSKSRIVPLDEDMHWCSDLYVEISQYLKTQLSLSSQDLSESVQRLRRLQRMLNGQEFCPFTAECYQPCLLQSLITSNPFPLQENVVVVDCFQRVIESSYVDRVNAALLLCETSGSGISTALAHCIRQFHHQHGNTTLLFYHFVTNHHSHTSDALLMLRRFINILHCFLPARRIRQRLFSAECIVNEFKMSLTQVLKIPHLFPDGCLLVIDGIDRMCLDDIICSVLEWLLTELSVACRVLASASNQIPKCCRNWKIEQINAPSIPTAVAFVESAFPKQTDFANRVVAQLPSTHSYQLLTAIVALMKRKSSQFEREAVLHEALNCLTATERAGTEELMAQVLDKADLFTAFDYKHKVACWKVLGLLSCSGDGLSANEIYHLVPEMCSHLFGGFLQLMTAPSGIPVVTNTCGLFRLKSDQWINVVQQMVEPSVLRAELNAFFNSLGYLLHELLIKVSQ